MFVFILVSIVSVTFAGAVGPKSGCSYEVDYGSYTHEFDLWGNVRVVESDHGADLQVYLAKPGEMVADLIICWTEKEPTGCGQWHRVTKDEDFTVSFVSDWRDADLIVMYGDPTKEYRAVDPF